MTIPKSRPSPQQQTNKYGLPYLPATPSTHASTYSNCSSGSSSRRSSTGCLGNYHHPEEYDLSYGEHQDDRQHQDVRRKQESWNDRNRYDNEEQYQRQRNSSINGNNRGPSSGERGRSESPQKRIEFPSTLSSRNNSNHRNTKASEQHNKAMYYSDSNHSPSIIGSTTVMTQSSQSTTSTTSSRKQLLLPNAAKSSNYSLDSGYVGGQSPYDSNNSNYDYHQKQVNHDQMLGDELSIQYEEDDETINTRPMIEYNLRCNNNKNGEHHQRNIMLQKSKQSATTESSFLDESFASIDFGSVNGVAPTSNPVTGRDSGYMNEQQVYRNKNDEYDENSDEDEVMLFHCNGNSNIYNEYDDAHYNCVDELLLTYHSDERHENYDDGFRPQDNEELNRAARRGSALASLGARSRQPTNAVAMNDPSSSNRHKCSNDGISRGQLRPPPETTTTVQPSKQQLLHPLQAAHDSSYRQQQSTATRRPQISRSMSSKRHLLAASARGVKVTTGGISSSNGAVSCPSQNVDAIPTSFESLRQRGSVTKVAAINEIELPRTSFSSRREQQQHPPQQQQQRRGSVTKASSHSEFINDCSILRQHQPVQRRSSSLRNSAKESSLQRDVDDNRKESKPSSFNDRQQQRQLGRKSGTSDAHYDDISPDNARASLNEQIRLRRGSVNKTQSHNDIEVTQTSSLPRGSVSKAASHSDIEHVPQSKQQGSRLATRRTSSIRDESFDAPAKVSQSQNVKQHHDNSARKVSAGNIASHRNHADSHVDEITPQNQHRQRHNVSKSASYNGEMSPRKAQRNNIAKAASYNGEFQVTSMQPEPTESLSRCQTDLPPQPKSSFSRRRSSLEHVPATLRQTTKPRPSFRQNNSDTNSASQRTMHQLPRARSYDLDEEYQCNQRFDEPVPSSRKQNITASQMKATLSNRRMSAGHVPSTQYISVSHYSDRNSNNMTDRFQSFREPARLTRSQSDSDIVDLNFVDDDGNDYITDYEEDADGNDNPFEISFSDLAIRR